jgi:hypothetical protein
MSVDEGEMAGAYSTGEVSAMRLHAAVGLAAVALSIGLGAGQGQGPARAGGYVPDEATAAKIAEAVLTPRYGEKQIEWERPFHAELTGDTWTVTGTMHCPAGKACVGGVAKVRISATDARILSMTHGK